MSNHVFQVMDDYRNNLKATKGDKFANAFVMSIKASAAAQITKRFLDIDCQEENSLTLVLSAVAIESALRELLTAYLTALALPDEDMLELQVIVTTVKQKLFDGQPGEKDS